MKTIGFICIHNSCRSQIAEAWGKNMLKDIAVVYSAGTEDYPEIKPLVACVMNEVGIEINTQYPKRLSEIPAELDILITMGCGVKCPSIPSKYREDWGIDDPSGQPIAAFRLTRAAIENKIKELKVRILDKEFE
ncbi:ArsC family transcriptional regulator [Erysipelotrichaceae bacterium]|nr:ArsC family transcriptional regulator [Erysipelotrichaceae bacterium]